VNFFKDSSQESSKRHDLFWDLKLTLQIAAVKKSFAKYSNSTARLNVAVNWESTGFCIAAF